MKKIALVILLSFFFVNSTQILALNTGFSTETMSEDDTNKFLSNIKLTLLTEEPAKRSISCFGVKEDSVYAIGSKKGYSNEKQISVYRDNDFLYGFSFKCTGDFELEWDGENLNICFVRGEVLISVNSDGEVLDLRKIQNTTDNNSHWNYLDYKPHVINNTEYKAKNTLGLLNFFQTSFSQLVMTSADGEETVLYDVSSIHNPNAIALFIAITAFAATVIVIVGKPVISYILHNKLK